MNSFGKGEGSNVNIENLKKLIFESNNLTEEQK